MGFRTWEVSILSGSGCILGENGGVYSHSVEKVSCIVSGESGEVLNTMRRISILV